MTPVASSGSKKRKMNMPSQRRCASSNSSKSQKVKKAAAASSGSGEVHPIKRRTRCHLDATVTPTPSVTITTAPATSSARRRNMVSCWWWTRRRCCYVGRPVQLRLLHNRMSCVAGRWHTGARPTDGARTASTPSVRGRRAAGLIAADPPIVVRQRLSPATTIAQRATVPASRRLGLQVTIVVGGDLTNLCDDSTG